MSLPPGQAVQFQFAPGVALFQVWEISSIIGGQVKVLGPYPDIGSASAVAASKPGALLVCCTALYATPHAPVAANKPTLTPIK